MRHRLDDLRLVPIRDAGLLPVASRSVPVLEAEPMTEIPEALRELRFILLKPKDKVPIEGVSWKDITAQYPHDHPRLAAHLAGGGNYGVICGLPDLVVVDIDNEEIAGALDIPRLMMPTFTVRTGKGTHYYLMVTNGAKTAPLRTPSGVSVGDIKAAGSYVVGPGSVHPSGKPYTVESTAAIRAVGPDVLQDIISRCETAGMDRPPAGKTGDAVVTEGARNDTLFRLASSLRSKGLGKEAIQAALLAENRARCRPSLPYDEVRRIAGSAGKYPPGPRPAPSLEEIHARSDAQDREGRILAESRGFIQWVPRVVFQGKEKERTEYDLVIDYPAFADWIAREVKTISFAGELWINHGGIYIRDFGKVKALITEVFNLNNVKTQINGYIAELHQRMINRYPSPEYPFNVERSLIPVANGVIRLNGDGTTALIPMNPGYHFNYRLPVTYDPTAPTEPVMAVLRSWVNEKDAPALIQYPAQAIMQALNRETYKRAYLFEGERDSGKTTYWLLIHESLGDSLIGNIELGAIGRNRFALASLEGKIVNFYDELGAFPIDYLGPFKRVTGGVWHEIERKGRDSYNGLVTAVHAFTCNTPPKVADIFDNAFFSRWNYVVFPNEFPRDPTWPRRTFTPKFLSGFLNLVISMIIQIRTTGELPYAMDPETVQELWLHATEPLTRYREERLKDDSKLWISTDEVYKDWVAWARKAEVDPRSKSWLTPQMARIGIHARDKKDEKRKTVRVYDGITWKDGAGPIPTHQDKPEGGENMDKWITTEPDGESRISLGKPPIYTG